MDPDRVGTFDFTSERFTKVKGFQFIWIPTESGLREVCGGNRL